MVLTEDASFKFRRTFRWLWLYPIGDAHSPYILLLPFSYPDSCQHKSPLISVSRIAYSELGPVGDPRRRGSLVRKGSSCLEMAIGNHSVLSVLVTVDKFWKLKVMTDEPSSLFRFLFTNTRDFVGLCPLPFQRVRYIATLSYKCIVYVCTVVLYTSACVTGLKCVQCNNNN